MSDPLVSLTNVTKSYRNYRSVGERMRDIFLPKIMRNAKEEDFFALKGVSLDIHEGERVGLIGRNGAGKSTLLKLVCGRGKPTSGSISVRGKVQALLGLGVGFSAEWTGRQNIYAALSIQGLSDSRIKMYEEEIIDFSELEEFIDQPVKGYSAGMYTRLAFAVATCLEPEILIIDEVLGAGDAAFVSKSAARMRRLTQESGATVLFVSHSAASVVEICNRAVLMENGRVVADDDPLTVNKIYNKKVRAEEELSLRAREQRIRKRDLVTAKQSSAFVRTLRLAAEKSIAPQQTHKIRQIGVYSGDKELVSVPLDGVSDSRPEKMVHVLHAYGMSNWGEPKKDRHGMYRAFGPFGGTNQHAPFMLNLPIGTDLGSLQIHLMGTFHPEEALQLDVYDDVHSAYVPLTLLQQSAEGLEYEFPKSLDEKQRETKGQPDKADDSSDQPTCSRGGDGGRNDPKGGDLATSRSNPSGETSSSKRSEIVEPPEELDQFELSVYGGGEVQISKVLFLDECENDCRVFTIGDKMRSRMKLDFRRQVERFSLVFCIYLRDGRQGAQIFVDSEELGVGPWVGLHDIDLCFDPLRLGEGHYMVSIGVFDDYTLTVERENYSYCVMDRAYEFKVRQPDGLFKGLGSFAHQVRWSYKETHHIYDPALDHRDIGGSSS